MGNLRQDLSFALRGLRKSPAFTTVAVLSLALGIGANTAIFTLLDQVLVRRLPVKDPGQLVLLNMKGQHYGSNWGSNAISYPLYEDLSRNNQVFSGMFCRYPTSASLSFAGQTERVEAELVSGTYFPVLGVGAALGRTFTTEEDQTPGGHPVVVLSHDYWRSRFAADPSVLGKTIVVNGHNMTIVGVAQPGFNGVQLEVVTQIFVPVMMKAQMTPLWDGLKERRWRFVNAFGRLKPGVTPEAAKASLEPFFKSILQMEVKEAAFRNASVESREAFLRCVLEVLPGARGRSSLREQLEKPLLMLIALTGGVLLISCANVANLLIARAAAREKEIALRLALGAGKGRLVRLLLVESAVLSALGALVGIGLAYVTDRLVFGLLPPATASLKLSPAPDPRILLFTATVAGLTTLVFGLAPALQSTRLNLAPTLKNEATAVAGGPRQARFRGILVSVQVALSLVLLVGAGLFVRTLMNLRALGPGFAVDSLVAFNLDPSLNAYKIEQSKAFYERLSDELRALPGVSDVGVAAVPIMQDDEWDSSVTVEGHVTAPEENMQAFMNSIGPGYFGALGVPIVAGRDFTTKDTEELRHSPEEDDFVPRVVIVNQKFARRFFGDQDPVGRHVGFGNDPGTPTDMEIVGVIKDIKYMNLRDEVPIQMFIPYLANRHVGSMTVYVRSSMTSEQITSLARERVRQLDSTLPIYGIRTMRDRVTDSLLVERLSAGLAAAFGVLASLLASVGLYGVMAYNVARRTREIGVRMALGAPASNVVWLVLRESLLLLGLGLLIGLPATLALARYIHSQLFGVHFFDPLTLACAVSSLAVAAAFAGFVPARRASRINPIRALRYE